MALTNFTVEYNLQTTTDDGGDAGSDVDEVGVYGEVLFTPVRADNRPAQTVATNTGRIIGPVRGWFDNGVLKNRKTGGVTGVRLVANDPVFGLARLPYRIEVVGQLTTAVGEPVEVDFIQFDAPDTDTTVDLAKVLPAPGSRVMGIVRVQEKIYTEDILDMRSTGTALAKCELPADARAVIDAVGRAEFDSLIEGAPGALDSLAEFAEALGSDPGFVDSVRAQMIIGATAVLTDNDTPQVSKVNRYNCAGGPQAVTLPSLADLKVGSTFVLEKDVKDVSSNSITFTCAGANTFDDGTTQRMIRSRGAQLRLRCVLIGLTKFWKEEGRSVVRPNRNIVGSYRPVRGIAAGWTVAVASGHSAGATFYSWDTINRWRNCGAALDTFDANHGHNVVNGLGVGQAFSIEFYSNATELRLHFSSTGRSDFWVMADDQRLTTGLQACNVADGDVTVTITPPAGMHKYRIGLPATTFRGISTNSGARLTPAGPSTFRLALIGATLAQGGVSIIDAITTGTAATLSAEYLAGQLEQTTGMDVFRMTAPGTGYVAEGALDDDGPFGSTARIQALQAIPNLDAILVWAAGGDDLSAAGDDVDAVVAAARTVWTQINAAQPAVPLIVMGTMRESDIQIGSTRDVLNTRLRAAALLHPGVQEFVDIASDPPFLGTGKWSSVSNDGNADVAIAADGTSVTLHGARILGDHVSRKLGELTIPASDLPRVLILQSEDGESFSDDFNRASLGSNWTSLGGSLSIQASSYLKSAANTTMGRLVYTATLMDTAGHYAEMQIKRFRGAGRLAIMGTTDMTSCVMVETEIGFFSDDAIRILSGNLSSASPSKRAEKWRWINDGDWIGIGYEPGTATYRVYVNRVAILSWKDPGGAVIPTGAAHRSIGLADNCNFGSLGNYGPGINQVNAYDWIATA